MADTSYGVYHLADNPSAFQPMRSNNFIFVVDHKLIDLLRAESAEFIDDSFIAASDKILEYSVASFDVPHFTQNEIPIKRGNSTVYFAGAPTFQTKNLVVNDYAGAGSKSVLEAWQNLSYNVEDDTINTSDKYKVNATVLEYLPDNTLIRYWELKGCWVSGISEEGWSSDNAEKKRITATIRYDWAIPYRNSIYDATIPSKY